MLMFIKSGLTATFKRNLGIECNFSGDGHEEDTTISCVFSMAQRSEATKKEVIGESMKQETIPSFLHSPRWDECTNEGNYKPYTNWHLLFTSTTKNMS